MPGKETTVASEPSFGYPSLIVLFQAGVKPQIEQGGQYCKYGTKIATCETLES